MGSEEVPLVNFADLEASLGDASEVRKSGESRFLLSAPGDTPPLPVSTSPRDCDMLVAVALPSHHVHHGFRVTASTPIRQFDKCEAGVRRSMVCVRGVVASENMERHAAGTRFVSGCRRGLRMRKKTRRATSKSRVWPKDDDAEEEGEGCGEDAEAEEDVRM